MKLGFLLLTFLFQGWSIHETNAWIYNGNQSEETSLELCRSSKDCNTQLINDRIWVCTQKFKMEIDCPICQRPLTEDGPTVSLREKGCIKINTTSKSRSDSILVEPGSIVHVQCRRDYTLSRNQFEKQEQNETEEKTLRSVGSVFDFKSKCLFCSKLAKVQLRKRAMDAFPVRTLDFQSTVNKVCSTRHDAWAIEVSARLQSVIDLPAAEADYHQSCSVNFRTGKQKPKQYQDDNDSVASSPGYKSPVGRREDEKQSDAFSQILKHIERNENEVIVVNDLVRMMGEICGEQKAYTSKHMKKKIVDYFGDELVVSFNEGKHDVVTFKQTTASIIHKFHQNCSLLNEEEEEKRKIILTAAKLIKHDIQSLEPEKDVYPSFASISSVSENLSYLPESLKTFLGYIIKSKDSDLKTASLGQSIVQACRPKTVVAPLQIGLGVQLHHHYGSRFLIDVLSNLGFCSTYWEVQRFERNAASVLTTDIPFQGSDTSFLQFVADNVDHNIRTLDGNGTFHGMGTIASTTPGKKLSIQVPRKNVSQKDDMLSVVGKIDIKHFISVEGPTDRVTFLHLPDENECNSSRPIDLFCKLIWSCRPYRPSWSGFMQMYEMNSDPFPSKSSVTFMPMIDLHPSDMTCINSTLHFVCEKAAQYGVTPVLTFDQPLFQKATHIISVQPETSTLRNIVLRLGPFHTEMSFLGCIGHLMSNSGLREGMERVYAPTAVVHMLTGKAIQRAVRAHMLIDTALHTLLIQETYPSGSPDSSGCNTPDSDSLDMNPEYVQIQLQVEQGQGDDVAILPVRDSAGETQMNQQVEQVEKLAKLYDSLENSLNTIAEIRESTDLHTVQTDIQSTKVKLTENRTASLWLQYIEMVEILQQFLRAERTGDWTQHLSALQRMLPFFAASGHNLYLKSAYIYLQNMLQLRLNHPEIYGAFMSGRHVVRRSDRYWAGLSTDLIIEQVLMRSLKTTGGLTRGRGMTEEQRAVWLSSMPICAEMNAAMQEVSKTSYTTSDQHKDTSKARLSRDKKDTEALLDFFQNHNPFLVVDRELRNIESGVTAEKTVNVEHAKEFGEQIVRDMAGQTLETYKLKRSSQVTTLGDSLAVQITGEKVVIDSQLLFQRLLTASDRFPGQMSDIFQYELCSYPSSLFDNSGLPRVAQKSVLADSVWKMGNCSAGVSLSDGSGKSVEQSSTDWAFVIDGGSLLHKIPWTKGSTFGVICDIYKCYLVKKYKTATVVFDGYASGATTKDVAHLRRNKGAVGTAVRFSFDTRLTSKKETFLKNPENKQNFILLLSECLNVNGICVRHASDDADCLIAQTAVEISQHSNVVVVGEDTDLLVLLCHHVIDGCMNVMFKSDVERSTCKVKKIWDIQQTRRVLGEDMCFCLPFLHALSGCDTTSRIFGIGKACVLNLFRTSSEFRSICHGFLTASDKNDVKHFGESALLMLFDAEPGENLDMLRYRRFASKTQCVSSVVQVQTLPPTSAAATFHSLRVYHQTFTWMGKVGVDPTDFGWEMEGSMLIPIKTDMAPAPEYLLHVVRCSCKNGCDSKRCSCKKHGLDCSIGCKECRGISCSNSPSLSDVEIFIDESL